MRVGIVGLGTAGATLACLLSDRGHDVTVIEQAEDPRPVGAGIWLQALGQQVLDRLDLLEPLRAASREVSRVEMLGRGGRPLVELRYDALPGATPALGVHRGTLFTLLHEAVRARGIAVMLGVRVTGLGPRGDAIAVTGDEGEVGLFDLVVGADGTRSQVRTTLGLARRDRTYDYGALWAIVDDPAGLTRDCLYQRLDGTRSYLGVLPTGTDRASLFWSVRVADMDRALARGVERWRDEARPLSGPYAALLEGVTELLPAVYRDVVVRSSYKVDRRGGAVLVGDAAHAMSPQLGAGTSLALADAWTLAGALHRHPDLATALRWYEQQRAAHVRWYQWWTRLMMPVFQSGLAPLAIPRDLLAPVAGRVPGVPGLLVGTLCGDRVSPRRAWRLP